MVSRLVELFLRIFGDRVGVGGGGQLGLRRRGAAPAGRRGPGRLAGRPAPLARRPAGRRGGSRPDPGGRRTTGRRPSRRRPAATGPGRCGTGSGRWSASWRCRPSSTSGRPARRPRPPTAHPRRCRPAPRRCGRARRASTRWSTATGRPTAATYQQMVALDEQVTAAAGAGRPGRRRGGGGRMRRPDGAAAPLGGGHRRRPDPGGAGHGGDGRPGQPAAGRRPPLDHVVRRGCAGGPARGRGRRRSRRPPGSTTRSRPGRRPGPGGRQRRPAERGGGAAAADRRLRPGHPAPAQLLGPRAVRRTRGGPRGRPTRCPSRAARSRPPSRPARSCWTTRAPGYVATGPAEFSCYPLEDGGHAYLRVGTAAGTTVELVGGGISNEVLDQPGNAAFGMNVFGGQAAVTWLMARSGSRGRPDGTVPAPAVVADRPGPGRGGLRCGRGLAGPAAGTDHDRAAAGHRAGGRDGRGARPAVPPAQRLRPGRRTRCGPASSAGSAGRTGTPTTRSR